MIGGSGVIGYETIQQFTNYGIKTYFTFNKNKINETGYFLDITNKERLRKIFQETKPNIVIHTAAITNVDLCETNKKLAESVNVIGTKNIVEECKTFNSKLVYLSTSFVFDGAKEKYFEDDTTCPTTFYGITKEKGEKLVADSGLDFLILRTDQPYSWKKKWQHTNSIIRVIETIKSNNIHYEIIDWYNRPTYVPNFVHSMKKLIEMGSEGIYHLVGTDFFNRYEIALMVADFFDLNKEYIKPIFSKELNLAVKRGNVNLDNTKIEKKGLKMVGIQEGLKEMIQNNVTTS